MPNPARGRIWKRLASTLAALGSLLALAALSPAASPGFGPSFLGTLKSISRIESTKPILGPGVPGNEDVNPYGIAVVPESIGALVRDDVLISNFNNGENEQGTGSTLVQISPTGHLSLFAQINASKLPGACPGGVGLTTALAILPGGFVAVGSLPAAEGVPGNVMPGCLIVLNSHGTVVETISGSHINGPWDMAAVSVGPFTDLFVSNVLNDTVNHGEEPIDDGTVARIQLVTLPGQAPRVLSDQVIATGFSERLSEEALVVGPTGEALGFDGTLYVADTQGNRIAAIPDALFRGGPGGLPPGGITVAKGGLLDGPLGLTLAPNGDILTANGGNGDFVETTPFGTELQAFETEASGGGLFGLALTPNLRGLYFVNDTENTLELLH